MYSADVNKIIPFSSVDGPGNRTAIFLQGCNFNCKYCHNPETRNLCINCMDCVPTCPTAALSNKDGKVVFEPQKCIACDTCIKVCKHGATPRIVRMTSKPLIRYVKMYLLSEGLLFQEVNAACTPIL